jgi:TonB-linked SusC/RagA family outer membrane protein
MLNPLAALEVQQGHGWSDKIVGNFFGEIKLFNDFKFRSSIGTDLAFWGGEGFTPVFYLNASNRNDVNNYNRGQNRGLYWIWENTLAYEKRFGEHKINAVIGTVGERNSGQGISGSIRDIPVDNIEDASLSFPTSAETQTYGGYEYLSTTASYLGRINYNYKGKYLLSAVLRRDGSSRFGSNYKFGNFPSISAGWVISDENFLLNNQAINFLKIRASWGINGNDRIGDFLYASTVGGGRNYTFGLDDILVNGVSPNALSNPDLRWEETTQINFGFDAKIFKKFSVTFDLFEKKTDDMLLGIDVPGYVGNGGPTGNIASLENWGAELELGYAGRIKNVDFDFSGNISYAENEITDLGVDKDFLSGQRFSPQGLEITRITLGQPIGHFYGYQTSGIFQNQEEVASHTNADGELLQPDAQPGDIRFVDFNGNGEIDPEDRTFIGDPTPTWTYGFNYSAGWKGFDVVIFAQGVAGNDVFKATRRFDLQMANMTADALGRWTGEGSSNEYPRLVMNDPNKNFSRSSDFYVENGAYFRVKTLQLGYSLPSGLIENLGFRKIRLYVSGNNLFTLTDYSGFDPEIGGGSFGVDRGIYPQPRFFLFGINATL